MQPPNPPTFSPTVWPAEPPKTPAVSPMRLAPVAGTGALEVVGIDAPQDLPPDFVFRELLTLDLAKLDVIEFTAKWGLAGGRGAQTFEVTRGGPADLAEELRAWEEQTDNPQLVHPEAVRWHLLNLRLMARHLLAYLDGAADITEAWQEPAPLGIYRPSTEVNAWLVWESMLNKGLSPFAVHVRAEERRPPLGMPRGGLFSACCLQLVHYLASDATVKRCANERCGQPFTKQRGTAKYGHRSRGVLYCSPQCAKAQSERERRRRRAAESAES